MTILQGLKGLAGAKAVPRGGLGDAVQKWIAARWEKVRLAYTIYHQSVWRSLLYYVGEIWIRWDGQRRLYTADIPSDRFVPRPQINRFAPAVDAICANFAVVPEVEAVPADSLAHGDDLRRHGIAEVANDLLDWWTDKEGLKGDYRQSEGKLGNAALVYVLTGCLFTQLRVERYREGAGYGAEEGVEADAAAETGYGDTPAPAPDAVAGLLGDAPQGAQWDICLEVCDPLCAFPRPGATGMKDAGWMLWAKRRSLDEIRARWDYDAQADEERASGASLGLEEALNFYYQGFGAMTSDLRDSALVIELFAPPGTEPKTLGDGGCYAVYCNQRVIFSEPWRFVEHPLTMAGYQQNPKLFFPRSVSFDLAAVQSELKDYESLVKLHAMVNAAPAWVADEATKVTEITGRADRVIWWRSLGPGSAAPHREPAQGLDPGIYQKIETLKEELEHISGAVQVFRGEQPGSVKAASAIQQLRGQAEQMFSRPVLNWNALWRETCRKAVCLMQRHMTFAQVARIVGTERALDIQAFLAADLCAEIEFVATQNGLPRTRDERRQELMLMWDKGALDLADANVRQKVYELFGETGMMQSFNADASRARKENRDIEHGGKPDFMPKIEDLGVHYSIHAQAIKAMEFDAWKPQARVALIAHALETKQALEQQAGQAPPAPKPPAVNVNFKDLPPEGQVQAAAEAGIQLAQPQPAAPVGGQGTAPAAGIMR